MVFRSRDMWYFSVDTCGIPVCGISVSAYVIFHSRHNVVFHSRHMWYFTLGKCGISLSACDISFSAYVVFYSRLTVAHTLPVPSDLQNDVG